MGVDLQKKWGDRGQNQNVIRMPNDEMSFYKNLHQANTRDQSVFKFYTYRTVTSNDADYNT